MKALLSAWQVWALLAAVFAALTAVFAKVGVDELGSLFATLLRTVVVLVALAVVVTLAGAWQPLQALSARGVVFLVLSGLATAASWACYMHALKLGDASRVAPLDKLSVVLVAVLGAFVLGETLSVANWFGVGLITLGAIMVAI
jgi:transporter family protein